MTDRNSIQILKYVKKAPAQKFLLYAHETLCGDVEIHGAGQSCGYYTAGCIRIIQVTRGVLTHTKGKIPLSEWYKL